MKTSLKLVVREAGVFSWRIDLEEGPEKATLLTSASVSLQVKGRFTSRTFTAFPRHTGFTHPPHTVPVFFSFNL